MMKKCMLMMAIAGVMAGCAASPDRYAVSAPSVAQSQRIAFASVEVREVSLPAYAAADEISIIGPEGRLTSDGSVLWADTPDRAVALELSRHLAQMSGARVASAPWPFDALPDARLDVRFETLVATADGRLNAEGQYFVAVPDGRRERSGLFDLNVAFDADAGPSAIAAARGQIILDLASYIARNGLR